MARTSFQLTDHSNEKSNATVYTVNLTAANFDAQATLRTSLMGSINNLSIGQLSRVTVSDIPVDSPGIPGNPFAQRELKWLVSYRDTVTGKMYQMEIPAANLTDNLAGNTDNANLASDDWVAFINAFEAYARAPDNIINTVEVVSARMVGRNI